MRSYLQIASGLTEMTRQRVTEVAKALVERSGLDLEQVPDQAQALPQYVQQVAEELYETGKANRDLLVGVVRGEVDKALSRSKPWTKDLVKAEEEIARLKSRVTDLEHRLARASTPRTARPAGPGAGSAGRPATPPAASRAGAPAAAPIARPAVDAEAPAAKKAAAKPPAAKKAAAKKTPASRPAAASAPAAAARKPARKTNGTAATKKAAPAKKAIRKPTAPTADADGQS
ncbi:histone [Embleya sp. NPDC008237]|uniref:histone n=1 Tax=Embleya sp. NPDC008237 TaxID=3363978 RepID=UPI0036E2DC09